MKYSAALTYLNSFTNYEKRRNYKYNEIYFNLDRIAYLLKLFDNPHNRLKCVHIAGTKGKGSVAILLSTILANAGYKVGVYTSPHIVDFRERIKILQEARGKRQEARGKIIEEYIPKKVVSQFTEKIKKLHSTLQNLQWGLPTTFELYTALAFDYFATKKVDLAVIEVGLGGRLDATNVIKKPLACIIARIGYDHMKDLGNTLTKIAYEKAGIIKENSNVIVLKQHKNVMNVIEKVAKKKKAKIYPITPTEYQQTLPLNNYQLNTKHQLENTSLAIATAELLNKTSPFTVKKEHIIDALKEVKLPGRCQIIRKHPTIMLDVAHNIDSIKAQLTFIKENIKYEKAIFVISIAQDKDIKSFLQEVSKIANYVIFTKIDNPRCATGEMLATIWRKINNRIEPKILHNLDAAINEALTIATPADLISITGSFYLIGEVLPKFTK